MNLLALPFYKDPSSQLRHGRCGTISTGLISPRDRFLPFVVKRPVTGQGLDCVRVLEAATGRLVVMILPDQFPCTVYSDKIWDYYTYFGGIITGLNLECGFYYLDVKGYFSEVFEVRGSLVGLLRVQWGNTSNIESIPYAFGFVQRIYLDTALAEPTYKHEEDGEDDGDKVFVALAHRLAKVYKFETLPLPEFMIDVLNSLALHNSVTVDDKTDLNGFSTEATWGRDSCAAVASVSFSERPVVAASCITDDGMLELDTSGYEPKPWLCGDDTDTSPFWEDTTEVRCVQVDAVYRSSEIRETVFRNNCAAGTTAGSVEYILPEGHSVSMASQNAADDEARAYFDANKQAFANQNATCTSTGGPQYVCDYANGGCFTGNVFDPVLDVNRPATQAECEACWSEFANNGSNCPPKNC